MLEQAEVPCTGLSRAGKYELSLLPAVVSPDRKEMCRKDFRLFCETYFPNSFPLAWSADHLRVIGKMRQSVLSGGLFAVAMPRGSGKTELAEKSVLWAMLYGHRRFIVIIGAAEAAAEQILSAVKFELELNELLYQDFPEVCYPVEQLHGCSVRGRNQTFQGKLTRLEWHPNRIVLPHIPGSDSSGCIVCATGISGHLRGMKFKSPDGRALRPDYVVVDDPQTAESAASALQTKKRIDILNGDILGLAGPGKKISGVMTCTVIRPGDLADTFLDAKLHPDWRGERAKLLYEFPRNMKLWQEYAAIRTDSLAVDGTIARATDFYRANRAEMDFGAVVGWPERYNADELSALQSAMNLMFRDEKSFFAEYQNDPEAYASDGDVMSAEQIVTRINGVRHGVVPLKCTRITAFIDVQKTLLYYAVLAWTNDFTGAVIDYGTWPEQKSRFFTLKNASVTMADACLDNGSFNAQLKYAFDALTAELLGRMWVREDGAELKIQKLLIDANWSDSTEIIYDLCRTSPYYPVIMPSHGHYQGADSQPMTNHRKIPGVEIGLNWMLRPSRTRAIQYVLFDSNFWKTFIQNRLNVPNGDAYGLTLYGNVPGVHQNFGSHLASEYRIVKVGRFRNVDEWKLKKSGLDNHWLDCTVGAAVAASICGCALPQYADLPKKTVKSLTYRDILLRKGAASGTATVIP